MALVHSDTPGKVAMALNDIFIEKHLKNHPELLKKYQGHIPKESSFKRLFKGGSVEWRKFDFFEEAMEIFFETYRYAWDPAAKPQVPKNDLVNGFSEDTVLLLRGRANDICSAEKCFTLTAGPVPLNSRKYRKYGVPCLIHGVTKGDARFDKRRKQQPDDVENGIWLCMTHAHDNEEYTAWQLQAWKTAHEKLLDACRKGLRKMSFSFNPGENQSAEVKIIFEFFRREFIYPGDYAGLSASDLAGKVEALLSFIEKEEDNIDFGTKLEQLMYALNDSCEKFMDIYKEDPVNDPIIRSAYGALVKVAGILLAEMSNRYKVDLPAELLSIVPRPAEEEDD